MPYRIRSSQRSVEYWSTFRPPFESKGQAHTFRGELRAALAALEPGPDDGIHCTYASDGRTLCDVENVLVYNLGSGAFTRLARKSLTIERRFHRHDDGDAHHGSYQLLSAEAGFRHWTQTDLLLRLDTNPLPRLPLSASELWWWIKQGKNVVGRAATPEEPLALVVRLSTPSTRQVKLAGLIKGAVDALVAAAHSESGSHPDAIRSLALRLGLSEETVREALRDEEAAVLGPRRLLNRFGATHQWNPADDRLCAIIMTTQPATDGAYTLSAELVAVTEGAQPLASREVIRSATRD